MVIRVASQTKKNIHEQFKVEIFVLRSRGVGEVF